MLSVGLEDFVVGISFWCCRKYFFQKLFLLLNIKNPREIKKLRDIFFRKWIYFSVSGISNRLDKGTFLYTSKNHCRSGDSGFSYQV